MFITRIDYSSLAYNPDNLTFSRLISNNSLISWNSPYFYRIQRPKKRYFINLEYFSASKKQRPIISSSINLDYGFVQNIFNLSILCSNKRGGCSVMVARSAVARADRVQFPASTFSLSVNKLLDFSSRR